MEKNWVIYLLILLTIVVSSCENFTQNEKINDEKFEDESFEEQSKDRELDEEGFFDEEFEDESYEESDKFYSKYEERFITDYASTNPEEDIAESFTAFILEEKPQSASIAKQKILFFYEFEGLINLRKVIRSRLGSSVVS
jgi:hypothetical protein|tara:strand:+ start:18205 stop:18624 length:420 start_codon:yes stop_codon:yes gene_type:complete